MTRPRKRMSDVRAEREAERRAQALAKSVMARLDQLQAGRGRGRREPPPPGDDD